MYLVIYKIIYFLFYFETRMLTGDCYFFNYTSVNKNVHKYIYRVAQKKQPPSDIAIAQPKLNIFISHFQGLKRRYFDTRSPNFIKK